MGTQLVAKDSSGMGNDLPLVRPPERSPATIQGVRVLHHPARHGRQCLTRSCTEPGDVACVPSARLHGPGHRAPACPVSASGSLSLPAARSAVRHAQQQACVRSVSRHRAHVCVYTLLVSNRRVHACKHPVSHSCVQEEVAAMRFVNSYALGEASRAVPDQDFTISFWARTQAWEAGNSSEGPVLMTLLSYATHADEGEQQLLMMASHVSQGHSAICTSAAHHLARADQGPDSHAATPLLYSAGAGAA